MFELSKDVLHDNILSFIDRWENINNYPFYLMSNGIGNADNKYFAYCLADHITNNLFDSGDVVDSEVVQFNGVDIYDSKQFWPDIIFTLDKIVHNNELKKWVEDGKMYYYSIDTFIESD